MMKILSPKARITLGLVGIMTSLVMLAFFLNLIPDHKGAIIKGRTVLAETIAVYSTALVQTAGSQRLQDDFKLLTRRNADLLSLALRHENGDLLVATDGHLDHWHPMSGEYSSENQVRVPIWAGEQKWGQLELCFETEQSGPLGAFANPMVQTTIFMGLIGFLIYYIYLGRVLRQLDPSRAIPARVRSALDTMAEGLLILDRKEQIVLANQAFSSMVGKSPGELMGYRAGELPWTQPNGERFENANRPWNRALVEGRVQKDGVIRLQLQDGKMLTFKSNCSPVLGDGNKYAGVLVSLNDITQLEEKEVELTKSKQEAEKANQAKSTFLANMSHEIRSPMTAILGFTEILKRGYVKNEAESLKYLNTIHSSGKSLLELINDILDLSKVESGRMEIEKTRVNPYPTIYEVLQMMKVQADEKKIDLTFEADGVLPKEITTDPARLRQIVFNLLSNAIKFTDKGRIHVSCRCDDPSSSTPLWRLEIADSGIGMSSASLKKIFDPFVQADSSVTRRFGGTGLGLAISRRFARAMGGELTASSELGKGSVFCLSLNPGDLSAMDFIPGSEISNFQPDMQTDTEGRWSFAAARVLVVDDGPENRELVKLLLSDAGLTLDEATNGQQGVEKALDGDFDLILMDVQMPVMDGFTAAKTMRENDLDVPIIALTANAMKGFDKECLNAGYSDYLSKPIQIDRFMAMVSRYLDGQKLKEPAAGAPVVSAPATQTQSVADTRPVTSKLPVHIDKFARIVVQFIGRLEEQLAKMQSAVASRDMETVADLAHWLKGAGGTVGFDVFTEPAAMLEQHAKNQMHAQVDDLFAQIQALAGRLASPEDAAAKATASSSDSSKIAVAPTAPAREIPDSMDTPVISRLANQPRLQPIIERFITTANEKAQEMHAAYERRDMEALASLAHWFKGSGGTVGYDDFTRPAEQLENQAKTADVKQAGKTVEQVQAMVRAMVPPSVDPPAEPAADPLISAH